MRRRSILLSLVLPLALGSCISSNPDFCDDPATCSESDGILSWGDDLSQPSSDLASAGSDLAGSNQDMSGAAIDLSKPGPSSIIRFDRKVTVGRSTIDITVIGPSDDGKEITKKGTPLPWVILSPGFATDHKQYQGYGDRLASYGIVTILQKSPSELNHATYRDETVQLITWLLRFQKQLLRADLKTLQASAVSPLEMGYFLQKIHQFSFHQNNSLRGGDYFSTLTLHRKQNWKTHGLPDLNKRLINVMGFIP